jgi:hypothetical protein
MLGPHEGNGIGIPIFGLGLRGIQRTVTKQIKVGG